jgi:hypothetical protein
MPLKLNIEASMTETVGTLKRKIVVKLIFLGYLTETHVIGIDVYVYNYVY